VARNVEIKARVRQMAALRQRVAAVADGPPETLEQTDTFFTVRGGRLKLREVSGKTAELIAYTRSDTPEPKESEYEKVAVADSAALRRLLGAALGVRGEVRKKRLVYRVGRTRVHLDRVRDLGDFLELEVELKPGEPTADGVEEARRLMRSLGVRESDLVAEAYVDLLKGAP
jgi:predicted adenylyl cyclase CyaB